MKLDRPFTMVSAYRHVCVREPINLIERKMKRLHPYKGPNVTTTQTSLAGKSLAITTNDKRGGQILKTPMRRLSPEQIEEHRKKKVCALSVLNPILWAINVRAEN